MIRYGARWRLNPELSVAVETCNLDSVNMLIIIRCGNDNPTRLKYGWNASESTHRLFMLKEVVDHVKQI